jgi:hypothetical protein
MSLFQVMFYSTETSFIYINLTLDFPFRVYFRIGELLLLGIRDSSILLSLIAREECPSGLRSTPGKRVYVNRVPWVRIPPLPTPRMI